MITCWCDCKHDITSLDIIMLVWNFFSMVLVSVRGSKIGPAQWASPVRPKLGPGWAIKLLAQKKPGQIWPGPARPIFFCLEKTIWPDRPDF